MLEKFLRLFSRKPAAPSPPAGESPFSQYGRRASYATYEDTVPRGV